MFPPAPREPQPPDRRCVPVVGHPYRDDLVPRASDIAIERARRYPSNMESTRAGRVATAQAASRAAGQRRQLPWRRPLATLVALTILAASLTVAPSAAAPRPAQPPDTGNVGAEASGIPEVSSAPAEAPSEPEAQPSRSPDGEVNEPPDAAAPRERRRRAAAVDPPPDATPTPSPRPTPWPTPAGVKGLDVSHWNPIVDFDRAADLGLRFVIAKASQGVTMRDELYPVHAAAARSAGLAVGAYHFFDYRKPGRDQARHFLATLRNTTGLSSLLPLVVDVETLSTLGKPNRTRAKARLHALLDELYRQTGRYPMIYTSRHMWKQVVGEPLGFGDYPLWVACWKCDTVHLPRGWSSWRFWQFGQFRFGGGLPRLDGNVYKASVSQLLRERQRVVRLDGGAAWAASGQVAADLRGYQGSHVRVALDDRAFGSWKPYEQAMSVDLGAKQGAREVRFQLRSFRNVRSPIIREAIQLDSVEPDVKGPQVSIEAGERVPLSGRRVRVAATMAATDATSGLDRSVLAASCDGVQRARSVRPAAGPGFEVDLERAGCTVRASATDRVGHTASRTLGPQVELVDMRRNEARVSFRGTWRTMQQASALGGSLTRTTVAGATASLPFDGAQFAIVARRGPSGGKLDVFVDGELVERVNLYAEGVDDRRVVYVGNVARGQHTLKLRSSATADSRSTGAVVWLDAVLILERRR